MTQRPPAPWITLQSGSRIGKTICGLCCYERMPDGCDPCLGLGQLPGVVNACCGHGIEVGYLIFENGKSLQFDARTVMQYSGPPAFDAATADTFAAQGGEVTAERMAPDVPFYFSKMRRKRRR